MAVPPVQLVWKDIRYEIPAGKGKPPKRILNGMSGVAQPGRVLSIIGSSGAGKSTLLNAIAGRLKTGVVTGDLLVNGVPLLDRSVFTDISAYVTQDDLVMETQTCEELLAFSARLRLPAATKPAARKDTVDDLIQLLALEKVRHSVVGSPTAGGLSGGERKRVHIGIELVANPSVIFLDEPTSGLDSYTALEVVRLTKRLAQAGRTVLCTIHQPSAEIFAEFDDLLVVHEGRNVYLGTAAAAPAYFRDSLGFVPNPLHTSCEFILDAIIGQVRREARRAHALAELQAAAGSADKPRHSSIIAGADEEAAVALADSAQHMHAVVDFAGAFVASGMLARVDMSPPAGAQPLAAMAVAARPGPLTQFAALSYRSWTNYLRDKVGLRTRLVQTLFFATLFSLLFANLTNSEHGVQDRIALLFMITLSQGMSALMQTALMFPTEKQIFRREYDDGVYGVLPYFFGKTMAESPFQFVFPTIFAIIVYFSTDLRAGADHFFIMLVTIVLIGFTTQSIGLLLGAAAPTPQLATALLPLCIVPFTLVSGFLASNQRLDPYWLWLSRISFMSYGYGALARNELDHNCFAPDGNCTALSPDRRLLLDGDFIVQRFDLSLGVLENLLALIGLMAGFRILACIVLGMQVRRRNFKNNLNKPGDALPADGIALEPIAPVLDTVKL